MCIWVSFFLDPQNAGLRLVPIKDPSTHGSLQKMRPCKAQQLLFKLIPMDCVIGLGGDAKACLLLGNGSLDFFHFLVELKLGFPLNPQTVNNLGNQVGFPTKPTKSGRETKTSSFLRRGVSYSNHQTAAVDSHWDSDRWSNSCRTSWARPRDPARVCGFAASQRLSWVRGAETSCGFPGYCVCSKVWVVKCVCCDVCVCVMCVCVLCVLCMCCLVCAVVCVCVL